MGDLHCYSWLRATGFYFIWNFGEVGCLATSKSSLWSKNLKPATINNFVQVPHWCVIFQRFALESKRALLALWPPQPSIKNVIKSKGSFFEQNIPLKWYTTSRDWENLQEEPWMTEIMSLSRRGAVTQKSTKKCWKIKPGVVYAPSLLQCQYTEYMLAAFEHIDCMLQYSLPTVCQVVLSATHV